MIYSIFSKKDTTLYEQYSTMNTGIDEVLTIEKIVSSSKTPNTYNSRALVHFDIDWTKISGSWAKAYLNLYTVSANSIPHQYKLEAFPVSGTWSMGLGRESNTPRTTDGSSWDFSDGTNGWVTSGSDWFTSNTATQEFTYENTDVRMDVQSILSAWSSSAFDNEGFVLKRSGSQETDANRYGAIQFFSENTHTVYPPRLEVCWDDKAWNTGSLTALDMTSPDDNFFYVKSNKGEYIRGSKIIFYVTGREKYPVKTYSNTKTNLAIKYVEVDTTSYSILDARTGETIIPHDATYTNVSCHATKGNFFEFYSDSLFEDRHYQIQLKYIKDGAIHYFNIKDTFKIVR